MCLCRLPDSLQTENSINCCEQTAERLRRARQHCSTPHADAPEDRPTANADGRTAQRPAGTASMRGLCLLVAVVGWARAVDEVSFGSRGDSHAPRPGEQKISFKPPQLDEEESESLAVPAQYKCDVCAAIAYQIERQCVTLRWQTGSPPPPPHRPTRTGLNSYGLQVKEG